MDWPGHSCCTCHVGCLLIFFSTPLLRRETLQHLMHKFQDIEFCLVEIGNFGWVQLIERLLKRKHGFERIALIQFCMKDRDAGTYETVLDVSKSTRADRCARACQKHRKGFRLAG